jgi:hypothetical protein
MDANKTQYAEKITIEEYNNQKDEYTQNALKELQKQMKQTKPGTIAKPTHKIFNNLDLSNSNDNSNNDNSNYNSNNDKNDDSNNDDENSVIEYSDVELDDVVPNETNVNLIIKHVSSIEKQNSLTKNSFKNTNKKKHDINNTNSTMTDAIYGQHEMDIITIQSLKDLVRQLNDELESVSRRNHYLKLDLNNAQCDNNDLKKQNKFLQTENENKQKQLIELRKDIIADQFYMMIMKGIIIILFLFVLFY